jgi:hypothetical protein
MHLLNLKSLKMLKQQSIILMKQNSLGKSLRSNQQGRIKISNSRIKLFGIVKSGKLNSILQRNPFSVERDMAAEDAGKEEEEVKEIDLVKEEIIVKEEEVEVEEEVKKMNEIIFQTNFKLFLIKF